MEKVKQALKTVVQVHNTYQQLVTVVDETGKTKAEDNWNRNRTEKLATRMDAIDLDQV